MTLASKVREFFHDLFCSRLLCRLETDLLMARSDLQQLRQDKDQIISDLRYEKAQLTAAVALYQVNINQRVGIDPTRKRPDKPSFNFNSPPAMSSWQKEVAEHDAQIEKELAAEEAAAKV